MKFDTMTLPEETESAPDGSEARPLLRLGGGSAAHFTVPPRAVSGAIVHRTVEEIWYFTAGEGQLWRRQGDREESVEVAQGTCVTIPLGTSFQVRNTVDEPLKFICLTMPPWPGNGEAKRVEGPWAIKSGLEEDRQ